METAFQIDEEGIVYWAGFINKLSVPPDLYIILDLVMTNSRDGESRLAKRFVEQEDPNGVKVLHCLGNMILFFVSLFWTLLFFVKFRQMYEDIRVVGLTWCCPQLIAGK